MKKILLLIILGSLVTSCKTTNPNDHTIVNEADSIKVIVEYSGDLFGTNKGVKKGDAYTITMDISPKSTMAELISAFHEQTGLDSYYTFTGGAPPNRQTRNIFYHHQVNNTMVTPENEKKSLTDWKINNNSTVMIEISGGKGRGAFD